MIAVYYETLLRNVKTGWAKFTVIPKELCRTKDGLMTCEGIIGIYVQGMPIEITGVEKNGIFAVEKARLPDHSEKSVRLVLSSVPGLELSEKQIKAICALCLNNLFEFIKNDGAAELLSNVLRGSKKNEMAHKIIATVRRLQNIYDDYNIFLQYNFPIDKIELLLKKNITLQDVKKKPYSILLKYEVPVDIVDLFAIRECNVNAISLKRYKGFVLDTMLFSLRSGSTCLSLNQLYIITKRRLQHFGHLETEFDPYILSLCINDMDNDVVQFAENNTTYLYLKKVYEEENKCLKHITRLNRHVKTYMTDYTVADTEKDIGIHYNQGQKKAFDLIKTSGLKILTGPPGSGKTAVINGLIHNFLKNKNGAVSLSATTGMAAKVMSRACGMESKTVNKLINVIPYDDAIKAKDLNDPIDAELIIVDEISMIGVQLFAYFLGAVKNGSIVILVGDEDQLLSVESGNVLHDLIASQKIEVCRLTEVMRQSGTICSNAQAINAGLIDRVITDKTFVVNNYSSVEDAIQGLEDVFIFDEGTILCPVKNYKTGTGMLNKLRQDPKKKVLVSYGKKDFKLGDPIIMTKTDYEKGYINGDMGTVIGSTKDEELIVDIDGITYMMSRLDMANIDLAYAITIHKSQGSEFDTVHIFLPDGADNLTTRRLLYTAVTRAKKIVYIYNVDKSMEKAISNCNDRGRMTLLKDRLIFEKNIILENAIQ